jgi:hypothetical protein
VGRNCDGEIKLSSKEIEAFEVLKRVLQNQPDLRSKIPLSELKSQTRFREDMGFDSIAMTSLFCDLAELRPDLEEAQVAEWKLIGDCLRDLV